MESEQPDVPWQRVQPISLLFVMIATLRQWIIPLVFGLFSARDGNLVVIGVGLLAFGILLAFAITRFITLRFRVGWWRIAVCEMEFSSKQCGRVPVNRIQNIDLIQNVLHRMFGVAEVRIETASGKEPEAILKVLSLAEVERLRAQVFEQANANATASKVLGTVGDEVESYAGGVAPAASLPVARPQLLLEISLKQFALAGLTSNRGFLIVPIVLGTLYEARGLMRRFTGPFNFTEQFQFQGEDFSLDQLPYNLPTLTIVFWLAVGIITSIVMLKIFSFVWFVIRFYGYQLWAVGDDLRISCGFANEGLGHHSSITDTVHQYSSFLASSTTGVG